MYLETDSVHSLLKNIQLTETPIGNLLKKKDRVEKQALMSKFFLKRKM